MSLAKLILGANFSLCNLVTSCNSVPSCKFVFVQKYLRAILTRVRYIINNPTSYTLSAYCEIIVCARLMSFNQNLFRPSSTKLRFLRNQQQIMDFTTRPITTYKLCILHLLYKIIYCIEIFTQY